MNSIQYLSAASVSVPLLFLLVRRKSLSRYHWVLGVLLIGAGISDALYFYLRSQGISNIPVVHAFFFLQFVSLSTMYNLLLDRGRYRGTFIVLTVLFVVYYAINHFVIYDIYHYSGESLWVTTVVMLTLSIMYYYYLLIRLPTENLGRYSPFWFNTAVMYYFSLNALLFFASNFLFSTQSKETTMLIWSFHNANNVVKNLLFGIGYYYAGRG